MVKLLNMNDLSKKQISKCEHCSLRHVCFPGGLSDDELGIFEGSISKVIKIKKKQKLFGRGDKLHAVYAIKAGSVKSFLTNPEDEQTQVLGFHLPGDLLGFDGFANQLHSCDVVAMEDSQLCELPVDNFEQLCEILPGLRKVMMQQVGNEISRHHSLVLTLGKMQTEERLATYLLRLSCYYKSRGYSCTGFNLPMPRHDLANFLGMAPETLSRMFARLEAAKVVTILRRQVVILDVQKLHDLSHELCRQPASD